MSLLPPMPPRRGDGRRLGMPGAVVALLLLTTGGCRNVNLPGGVPAAADRPAAAAVVPLTSGPAVLRVAGRHFIGPDGRVVLLRGVNLGGDSKLPPFRPLDDPAPLDRLAELGFNVLRLPFIWEGYEPEPGRYDEAYLARMVAVADAAWARGLFVIVDIHQDGFARTVTRGCGAGFPLWAVSPRATPHPPDNGCDCKAWALMELTDLRLHRSFADFYADAYGVRTRYLVMLGRVAGAFAAVPGVVGYDPLNEPWGDEREEIAPLYRDAAAALRARHPTAILFLEGAGRPPRACGPGCRTRASTTSRTPRIITNPWPSRWRAGAGDRRHRPGLRPHGDEGGGMGRAAAGRRVRHPGGARRAGDYVDYLYDRLDAALASAAQWDVSPRWTPWAGDGWNGEDFSLLDGAGRPRPNYRPRPYPRRVAGVPLYLRFEPTASPRGGPRLEFAWSHRVGLGPTEIAVPAGLFPPGSRPTIEPGDATCHWDEARRLLSCDAPRPTTVRVVLERPEPGAEGGERTAGSRSRDRARGPLDLGRGWEDRRERAAL